MIQLECTGCKIAVVPKPAQQHQHHAATHAQDVYPGLLDTVISGVCHFGEEYEETALRELSEELGLPSGALSVVDLTIKKVFRWQDDWCDVWGCAFVIKLPRDSILELQEEEITSARFLSLSQVWAIL